MVGVKKNHLVLKIERANDYPFELILFNYTKDISKLNSEEIISAVFHLEVDEWNGRKKVKGIGKCITQ